MMAIACICGGTIEAALMILGFGCLCKLFGRKGKCKCDHKEHENEKGKEGNEGKDGNEG